MTTAVEETKTLNKKDYRSEIEPTWCPGCGDFGVLDAISAALAELAIPNNNVAFVSGIGCSSRLPFFMKAYGIHSLHGRVLPIAAGIKLSRPDLSVVAVGGDGDAYSIGGGHLPHAARRNIDITYIVMDNEIYGLTKGQVSPTSAVGFETHATPYGSFEEPINPVALAIAYGATFVARGFSGKPKDAIELIKRGIQHKGFSLIDIFSPCPTFNKVNTNKWYLQYIDPVSPDHDTKDRIKAITLAMRTDKIPVGVLYQIQKQTYEGGAQALISRLKSERKDYSLAKLMEEYQ